MPRVYRNLVEAKLSRPPGMPCGPGWNSIPSPPHSPSGEPAHTEADTPHVNANIAYGPLSETHPPVKLSHPHNHPYQSSRPLFPSTSLSLSARALPVVDSLAPLSLSGL